jgi:hypothetical protein
MDVGVAIVIFAEFLVAVGIIIGFAHEDAVIRFENRIFAKIHRRILKFLIERELFKMTKDFVKDYAKKMVRRELKENESLYSTDGSAEN